ncbi:MAG: acyltransferase [Tumebacillaceae bacterium]
MADAQTTVPLARRERIGELDVLRALAFLAVVLQHSLGVYIRSADVQLSESTMLGMLFNLSKFAVPTFVFITGLTLLYNYYERVDYPRFLWKRAVEILLPYALWCLVYEVYLNDWHLPALTAAWAMHFGRNVLLGSEYYHLWFIPMTFQFYLLYPLLLWVFKQARRLTTTRAGLVAMIALLLAAYGWLMWFTIYRIGGGHVHPTSWFGKNLIRFLDMNFVWWSGYFFLGAMAGVALHRWREFVVRSVNWNGFLFVGLFLWVGYELMRSTYSGPVNLNFSTSLKPSMFFYTVSEVLLLYGLSMAIAKSGGWLHQMFAFFGKHSYGAYLAHALLLNYVIRAIAKYVHVGNYVALSFVLFAGCAIATALLVFLISKIPYGNLLVGSAGKKKKKPLPA